ncbi:hypothetical protein Zm00014a_038918 [Zea mays]|uniref:Uncharacterized protein n=1 Tax=Zea mays TaxID=4577 RepID=A0A3L6F060_MAIZE|nr:hypothetical protein Zm00014a_038918 [Zea mays]
MAAAYHCIMKKKFVKTYNYIHTTTKEYVYHLKSGITNTPDDQVPKL